MKLSIVLSAQPAQFAAATFKGDIDENLAQIASLRYQGVELAIRDPSLLDADALDRLIHKHALAVPALGTGQAWGEEGLSFTDPDADVRRRAIGRIKSHIPLARRWGALIIIGLIRGVVKPGVDAAKAMEWLVDAIKYCADAAQSAGVRLALEPINRYETSLINNVSQGVQLIERVGCDNFGLLLDTFHMNIEEADIQSSIRAGGRHIFHFHVADSNRWYPGAGHLDFRAILDALDATSYKGWISGEFLPQPDAVIAAERSIEFLAKKCGAASQSAPRFSADGPSAAP